MESYEYYAILADRRKQLDGPETLKDLCLSTIKRNSSFFEQVNQETDLNPFSCISNLLKLELLGDSFSKWGRWEQLLVNKQVTSVTIETDNGEAAAYFKIWRSLCLENVTLRDLCWTSPEDFEDPLHPERFICGSSICANLQTLKLRNFFCTDLHLQMFASQLKKLRVLSLDLTEVTVSGISALMKLEHLEEFPFTWSPEDSEHATTAYNLCLQLMPKLHVIGNDWFDPENGSWQELDDEFHVDFDSIPKTAELGLGQLILHDQYGLIPTGITFSNLTCLRLWDPVENFRFDARFSKVTDLGICFLGMDKSLRLLNQIGYQLLKLLILEKGRETLHLDMILRLCPNLQELSLLECPKETSFSSPLEPETDLQALKILRVDMNYYSKSSFSPRVLVQLLMAPNLRYVKLFSVDLTKEDAEAIISLVQQGQILQKLEKFEVKNYKIVDLEFFQKDIELRARYDLVLLNMAKYCPCFVDYEEHVKSDRIV